VSALRRTRTKSRRAARPHSRRPAADAIAINELVLHPLAPRRCFLCALSESLRARNSGRRVGQGMCPLLAKSSFGANPPQPKETAPGGWLRPLSVLLGRLEPSRPASCTWPAPWRGSPWGLS
jgi:hypothetical protein